MKRKRTFGEDLDWYLIPVENVKKVVLVVVLILVAAAAIYIGANYFQSPKTRARLAIKGSQAMADEITQLSNFATLRQGYLEIQEQIQEAQKAFYSNQFEEARLKAIEAKTSASNILKDQASENPNPDAKIMRLEGEVDIQRRGQGVWEMAKPRDDLFDGDFVKTGKNGAVEITVGSIILKLGPDTLYEVTSKREVTRSGKPKIRMVMGEINIFTQSTGAGIETPVLTADLNKQTVAEFTTDKGNSGTATIFQGEGGEVTVGGQTTVLSERERLQVTGSRVSRSTVLEAPQILSPPDNRSVSVSSPGGVRLEWGTVKEAAKYHLQISKTSFFTKLLDYGDIYRNKNFIVLKINAVGDYYWRVAAVGTDGKDGIYSSVRKFRMVARSDPRPKARPPKLNLESLEVISRVCVIKGTVESGGQVEINGERVEVKPDNTFTHIITFNKLGMNKVNIKASNVSGGETLIQRQVLIEEF